MLETKCLYIRTLGSVNPRCHRNQLDLGAVHHFWHFGATVKKKSVAFPTAFIIPFPAEEVDLMASAREHDRRTHAIA